MTMHAAQAASRRNSYELPLAAGPYEVQRGLRADTIKAEAESAQKGRKPLTRYKWNWVDTLEDTPKEGWVNYLVHAFGIGDYRIYPRGSDRAYPIAIDREMAATITRRFAHNPPGPRQVGTKDEGDRLSRIERLLNELLTANDGAERNIRELETRVQELEKGLDELEDDLEQEEDDDEPRAANPVDIDALVEAKLEARMAKQGGLPGNLDMNAAIKLVGDFMIAKAQNPPPTTTTQEMPDGTRPIASEDAALWDSWGPLIRAVAAQGFTAEQAQQFVVKGMTSAAIAQP